MANPEHLAKLKEGVEAWNAWREADRATRPSLMGANLVGENLAEANLVGANLRSVLLADSNLSDSVLVNANLSGANIRDAVCWEANLAGANLSRTDLSGAGLQRAEFGGASLVDTNLTRANLSRASLMEANLNGVTLSGAILKDATLGETVLANLDLSETWGLDTCEHYRPSIIDHRTLVKSGPLPLGFLRGCGLSDKFIDYIPSIFDDSPIEHYSTFISYSTRDQEFASRLHADLQDKGVRCWFAPEDLKIGDKVRDTIDQKIRIHDKLLLILSGTSIGSDWVEHEVERALDEEERRGDLVLFPIRIDGAVMEAKFGWAKRLRQAHEPSGRHIGDFTEWKNHDAYKKAFDRLLRDLKVERPEG